MSAVSELFVKPEIPVSARVPDALSVLAERRGVSIGRAIRLGIYALLEAHEAGEADIRKLLVPRKEGHIRRTTIRLPLAVHDRIEEIMHPMTVSVAVAAIATLYLEHPDTLDHV